MICWDKIDEEMKNSAFLFFYSFSRFEFALKENGLVTRGRRGSAQADWQTFVKKNETKYDPCEAAGQLMAEPPDVQQLEGHHAWKWAPLQFDDNQSQLSQAVLIVKTVRNNLFHGGKHSAAGWDEPERVHFLLSKSVEVLDSFVELAGYEADYQRRY